MKKKKKKIGSAILIAVLAIGIVLFSLMTSAWNNSSRLHAFLGEMYLDAMNYELALASFQRAIEIEPKNEKAYQLLAAAYEEMDEEQKAIETLYNGYLQTQSRDIRKQAKEDYGVDVTTELVASEEEVVRTLGMDVCFVIDTTGSMDAAIGDAKANMKNIIAEIAEKSPDYRIAIVDFRDYAERTGRSYDYPAMLQLDFTSDEEAIQNGIDGLSLGHGGDTEETVFSGLMLAASLDWRDTAEHIVILIGDAGPLSPEPVSGYTFDDVKTAMKEGRTTTEVKLFSEKPDSDIKKEKETLAESAEETFDISVYGIVTDVYSEGIFDDICSEMGGSTALVGEDSSLSEEICSVIEQVEIVPVAKDVTVDFGREFEDVSISVYSGNKLVAVSELNSRGEGTLEEMLCGTYCWKEAQSGAMGQLSVLADKEEARINVEVQPNARLAIWHQILVAAAISAGLLAVTGVILVIMRFRKRDRSK